MPSKNTKLPNPKALIIPPRKNTSMLQHGGDGILVPQKFIELNSSFFSFTSYYMPIGTKNVKFSVISINLLPMLNFLNPKNLVGSMNYGGGNVLARLCKSTPELDNLELLIVLRIMSSI
ncbi:hypothetical protein TNCV_3586621 [Trichonephila clavipes]|nr:hypothetical protein TNCV_3586621 [Trichonephila clavipes]